MTFRASTSGIILLAIVQLDETLGLLAVFPLCPDWQSSCPVSVADGKAHIDHGEG